MTTSPSEPTGASQPAPAPHPPLALASPAAEPAPATAQAAGGAVAAAPTDAPASASYPEPDKLGPIPSPTPAVPGDEVRARVLAEVKDAVAAARAGAAKAAADPVEAVHEIRKALRRMRAVVDAVRPALSRDAHRAVTKALVEARRALGPSRDLTVAHGVLAGMPDELAEHARAVVAASLEQAPPADAELDLIARAVAEADAQAVALAAALPDRLRAREVARGLARTYARARQARRRARRSERAIHRWRRRAKELIYQLSLVADDERLGALRRELVEVDDTLGYAVDRLLLSGFVSRHGGVLDGAAAGALLAHVHDEMLAGRDQARGASKKLYGTRPGKLRKRLRRAIRARAASEPATAEPAPEPAPESAPAATAAIDPASP